jgi:hypothetical protein
MHDALGYHNPRQNLMPICFCLLSMEIMCLENINQAWTMAKEKSLHFCTSNWLFYKYSLISNLPLRPAEVYQQFESAL